MWKIGTVQLKVTSLFHLTPINWRLLEFQRLAKLTELIKVQPASRGDLEQLIGLTELAEPFYDTSILKSFTYGRKESEADLEAKLQKIIKERPAFKFTTADGSERLFKFQSKTQNRMDDNCRIDMILYDMLGHSPKGTIPSYINNRTSK